MHAARALLLAVLACAALAADPPAVGPLTEQLAASDVQKRRDAALHLAEAGPAAKAALPALIKALEDADKQVRTNSLGAIAALGRDAAEAIPALLAGLTGGPAKGRPREREQVVFRSAHALSRIGTPAVPPLIQALAAEDPSLRSGAARALGGMGPSAVDAVPALISNLGHADAGVRQETVDALAAVGPGAAAKLLEALTGAEPLQRAGAASALGGTGAKEAGAALMVHLSHESDVKVRAAMLVSAARLGDNPAQLGPLLVEALKSEDDTLNRAAIDALVTTRPVHPVAVPLLTALLQDPDVKRSSRAAVVLGGIGREATSAAPDLVAVIAKQEQPTPAYLDALAQLGEPAIAAVLASIGSLPPEAITGGHWSVACLQSFGSGAVSALTAALSHPERAPRIAAVRALGRLGKDAASSEAALLKALSDPEPHLRGQALAALGAVTAAPKLLLPRVEAALKDSAAPVRAGAFQLVPMLEHHGRALMPAVIAGLQDSDEQVRQAALQAVGPGAEEAAPILIERLANEASRTVVIEALMRLGPAAAPATPKFVELLPSATKELQLTLLKAFGQIGATAHDALPALTTAVSDLDKDVRAAALAALAAVERDATKKLPVLAAAVEDPESTVRTVAMSWLGALGEPAAGAAPSLVKRLNVESDRGVALEALRKVKVRDVPSLIAMLKVSDGNIRVLACERLATLGPEAREALPHLQAVLQGAGERVRVQAQQTIDKINAQP